MGFLCVRGKGEGERARCVYVWGGGGGHVSAGFHLYCGILSSTCIHAKMRY